MKKKEKSILSIFSSKIGKIIKSQAKDLWTEFYHDIILPYYSSSSLIFNYFTNLTYWNG